MIQFTGYDLLWLFFIYSFAGWVLETAAATFMHRKFSNRGLVNGPLCILYGVGAVAMSVGLQELTGLWLFLFASLYAAVTEFVAGKLIERFYHKRWWDYSKSKWNLDGYICLPVSLIKGALGYVVVKYANRWVFRLLAILPQLLVHIVLLVLIGVLVVDVLASYLLVTGKSRHPEKWLEANNKIDRFRIRLGNKIAGSIEKRMTKAYPKASFVEKVTKDKTVFAKGCDFYKIVMLFFVGAFLGDITETIFCRITAGVWMSRSSVIYGPFSIVWGLGCAFLTLLLYRYRNKSDGSIFLAGTLLGGAYEYICSVFTEMVFGTIFWDYSGFAFNLGGRINLLYCFFWGIAAVLWLKFIYPKLSCWIEKIPKKMGTIICNILIVFMIANMLVSALALARYTERNDASYSVETTELNGLQRFLDDHYPDARMERIYPNAKMVD